MVIHILWRRPQLADLKPEERAARAKSLFSEYLSSGDTAEATACVRELSAPGGPSAPAVTAAALKG